MNAAIGVDMGSYNCCMAAVKQRGIDIILNDGSNRTTPVQAAFQAKSERIIGDNVKVQSKRNFKNTIMFPTRYLGLNATCTEQLKLEKQYITHKIVNLPNNKIAFEVNNMGTTHQLSVEQVLAFYLRKIKVFYEKAEVSSKDFVLSIPAYASNAERQALLDAAEIAGLKCLRVINENTAIVYNYGFFRKKDLPAADQKERVVCFIDMGHSKTTVTIAAFKQGEARILTHRSDRNLGGRNFDLAILEVIGGEFEKKYGDDPREAPRCRLRMFEAAEKARKLLSGDTEANINIDYLMNEEDLNKRLTREEFEKLIQPDSERYVQLLTETLAQAQLTPDKIDFVEMVGDSTRTPLILQVTKDLFQKEELSRTLNSVETVARGASLASAMLNPSFTVANFKVIEYNSLPVTLQYTFHVQGEEDKVGENKDFFKLGQNFPMTQDLKFNGKEGDMTVTLNYSPEVPLLSGLPTSIAQYRVAKGKRTKADIPGSKTELQVRVQNNIHQIPELTFVRMKELWTEEEKIPEKTAPAPPKPAEEKKAEDGAAAAETPKEAEPTANAEQKYTIKQRKREVQADLKVNTMNHAIPPDQRTTLRQAEDEMYAADRKLLDLKEAKYNLESYTYEMKNKIDSYGALEHYIDPAIKGAYMETLAATEAWIYAEGENAPLEDQTAKLQALQATGEPIKARHRFREEFEEWVSLYEKAEQDTVTRASGIAHMTEESKTEMQLKLEAMRTWLTEVRSVLEAKQKHEDIPYTLTQVENKLSTLQAEVNGILSRPPPAPKKEEEKKEETAEGEKPAEGEQPAQGEQPAASGEDADMKKEDA